MVQFKYAKGLVAPETGTIGVLEVDPIKNVI